MKELSPRSQATRERYRQAKILVEGGMPIREAATQVGMANATFYALRNQAETGERRPGKPGPKLKPGSKLGSKHLNGRKHKFIDISPAGTPGPARMVAVILCPVDQLQTLIKELQ